MTIVAWQRECLFGEVVKGDVRLSQQGEIVQKWWDEIPKHFQNVETGAFVVMPNHVHGIIHIVERRGTASYSQGIPVSEEYRANEITDEDDKSSETQGRETPPLRNPTLGQIVAYFKYQSTKEMNLLDNTGTVTKFWQRNYYEHIICDETDLQNKTDYINANPLLWEDDDENPINSQADD